MLSFEKSTFTTSNRVLNHGVGSRLKTIQYYLIVFVGYAND